MHRYPSDCQRHEAYVKGRFQSAAPAGLLPAPRVRVACGRIASSGGNRREGVHAMDAQDLRALQTPLKERYKAQSRRRADHAEGARPSRRRRHLQRSDRQGARGGRTASGDRWQRPQRVLGRHAARSARRLRRRDAQRRRDGASASTFAAARFAPKAISIFAARWASPRMRRSDFSASASSFDLDTDASEDQLSTLMRLTERYCVVYQTLRNSPEMTVYASRLRGLKRGQP